jgi:hypothetical protein
LACTWAKVSSLRSFGRSGGAKSEGIQVITAEFGPSAQEFVAGKPLTLIGGKQLVELISQYGIA